MYMDPESQRVVANEIELLGVQHAPQGLQERGKTEEHFNCSGDVERGPGSNHTLRKCASRRVLVPAAVTVFMLIAIITIAALADRLRGPPAVPCCPDGWIGYRGKCYYFSETDGNWTYSQSQCSALNASLAAIDSEQEKMFLLRHKDIHDHWIGLWREQGQPWKWTNGTKFIDLFRIRGGGDCAYLNDEKGVSSSRCYMERRWICSKPEVYVMGKGTAVEGSSK